MAAVVIETRTVYERRCPTDCACTCHSMGPRPGHNGGPCPGRTTHQITFQLVVEGDGIQRLRGRRTDSIHLPAS